MIALKKRQETSLAVFLALGISFLLWIVAENSALFGADVAGPVVEFDESSDVITYVSKGEVRLVAGKSIENISSISMLISYDPETVTINEDAVNSSLTVSFANGDEGRATIILNQLEWIKKQQELAQLNVEGEAHDIAISDLVATFTDGSTERLSISTL